MFARLIHDELTFLLFGAWMLTSSLFRSILRSYASDVTSGLSDGYEGLSEKSERTAARRTAGKLFRRRARSRLRITGVLWCLISAAINR